MKRDLVTFAQQNGTLPADVTTFYETKTPEERKRLAALAQENRNMEEWWKSQKQEKKVDGWVELCLMECREYNSRAIPYKSSHLFT